MKSLKQFLEHTNNKTADDAFINFIIAILKQNGGKISFEDYGGALTLDSIYDGNDEQVVLSTIYLSKDEKEVFADCDSDTKIKSGTPLIDLINYIDDWYTISIMINNII